MTSHKNKKNSLTIRLAESAVFLRTDLSHTSHTNGPASNAFSRDGMLRGLLVLDLVKPTKITSIEVELTALTTTSCPEGVALSPPESSTSKTLQGLGPIAWRSRSNTKSFMHRPLSSLLSKKTVLLVPLG